MEFKWRRNERGQLEYCIHWNTEKEPYQVLHLHYENISPIRRIKEETVRAETEKKEGWICIYARRHQVYESVPGLPAAVYRFSLYDSENKSGRCLASAEHYVGSRVKLYWKEEEQKNGFARLRVFCAYHFPGEQIGLIVKAMPEEVFSLPAMKKGEKYYETSALITRGASRHMEIYVENQLREFIEIVKEEDER